MPEYVLHLTGGPQDGHEGRRVALDHPEPTWPPNVYVDHRGAVTVADLTETAGADPSRAPHQVALYFHAPFAGIGGEPLDRYIWSRPIEADDPDAEDVADAEHGRLVEPVPATSDGREPAHGWFRARAGRPAATHRRPVAR